MFYIGIDVGANGGISVINEDGIHVKCYVYSDVKLREICDLLKSDCKAIVEKVHAMPHQGTVSMFNFGKYFGYIIGVLEANHIDYQLVTPQRWKRYFGVTSDKQTSIDTCRKLFPDVNLLRSKRARTPHDGMAESLLLAEWGRRHNLK